MSHCKWYLKLLEIPRDADNAKCMHICPIKAERCFLAIYEESCAFYGKWIQIILSVCVSQSSISSIYHIVDGEWRLEDTSHYVNYFTVGIIFWGQLMQNKILLAGGPLKIVRYVTRGAFIRRLRRPSPGISRHFKSSISAQRRTQNNKM